MSRTLSTNNGSLESLNVSERCGCKPKAFQILRIVVMRKPGLCRHGADRPVRGILWRGPKRALNDGGDLIIIDCPGSARTGLVQQPFDAVLQKASTPLADGVLMDAEFARNEFAGQAIRASEDNTAAFGQRPRRAMATNLPFEIRPFIRAQDQGSNRTSRRVGHDPAPTLSVKAPPYNETNFSSR